jgi:hypothetical protein
VHFFFFLLLFWFFIFIPDVLCLYTYNIFVFILAAEINATQDNANNNIDKNEMTCEFNNNNNNNNNNKNSQINNNTMIWVSEQPQLISTSYLTQNNERTISSSSSEQLIPKEKQTGKEEKNKQTFINLIFLFISRNVFSCIW